RFRLSARPRRPAPSPASRSTSAPSIIDAPTKQFVILLSPPAIPLPSIWMRPTHPQSVITRCSLPPNPVQSIHTPYWRDQKSNGPHLPLPRPPLRPRPRQHGRRRHPALRQDHPGHAAALLRGSPYNLIRVIL